MRIIDSPSFFSLLLLLLFLILITSTTIIIYSTVSAPGKILVAGGYLVLEKPNIGVTISATARFYTTIILNQVRFIFFNSIYLLIKLLLIEIIVVNRLIKKIQIN